MLKGSDIADPIVFIDDDHDDQFFFKTICKEIGVSAELIFFDNGKDALHYLKTTVQKVFIIMCDINMPVMNGIQVRQAIQEDEELKKKCIPFVFLSTHASRAHIMAAYEMTVQGFFIKQANLEAMEDTIKQIFEYWKNCKHPNA
jgi:CheY-like chemotaxis protein